MPHENQTLGTAIVIHAHRVHGVRDEIRGGRPLARISAFPPTVGGDFANDNRWASRNDPVARSSRSDVWWRPLAVVMSAVTAHIVTSFALYAVAMNPGVLWFDDAHLADDDRLQNPSSGRPADGRR